MCPPRVFSGVGDWRKPLNPPTPPGLRGFPQRHVTGECVSLRDADAAGHPAPAHHYQPSQRRASQGDDSQGLSSQGDESQRRASQRQVDESQRRASQGDESQGLASQGDES